MAQSGNLHCDLDSGAHVCLFGHPYVSLIRIAKLSTRFLNAVPQTSGIQVAKSVSICYLVFSIAELLLLLMFYEIVLYTLKGFLKVNRFIAFAWGIAMIVLGILVITIEIPLAKRNAESIWKAMSTNQRDYFENDSGKLAKTRGLNSMYIGIFTIVKGCLFLGVGACLFLLDRDLEQRLEWPITATLPAIEKHEQFHFIGMSDITTADHDQHHLNLKEFYPVKEVTKNDKGAELSTLEKQVAFEAE